MKTRVAFLIAALMLSAVANAEWTVSHDAMQSKWAVSDGVQQPIFFKDKKNADKAAKAINKAESNDDKGSKDKGGGK